MAFDSRCSRSSFSLASFASLMLAALGASASAPATTSCTPWEGPAPSSSSSLTSSFFVSILESSSSGNSSFGAVCSRNLSPPRLVARPPFSKFLYMLAKPVPFSCFSAAFIWSLNSWASSSSSNFFRFFSSSLKASVTKTSQSFRASFSFFRRRSSTICCSTFRRSVATRTFSMYFACLLAPDFTWSDCSFTTSPTRFFCCKPSTLTDCGAHSRSASALMSSSTSSYWKMVGSSCKSVSASRCACIASCESLDQAGFEEEAAELPSSSSDSWKSAATPLPPPRPGAAFRPGSPAAPKARPPKAGRRAAAVAGRSPGAALLPALPPLRPKPKPLNAPRLVFSGPRFIGRP
mmetsp:Transcript_92429/g.198151  ORF Transcript_92429/g.198151 Transcript_92429/m.198151 type:complete len:349 (-) Transcript_92429:32-1078(-)